MDPATSNKRKVIKMSDLADLAGVSKSTVSRALAGNPLVSQETRERIARLAKEHNYRLNTQARNFRLKESMTIGLSVPSDQDAQWQIHDPFFLELMGYIASSLNSLGHELLLSNIRLDSDDGVTAFASQRVCDGLIIIGQSVVHERLNRLADINTPMVVWGAQVEGQRYCTVGGDSYKGGRLVAEHLLDQGCRRIAILGDFVTCEGAQRLRGFRAVMAERGIEHSDDLLVVNDSDSSGAMEVTKELLSRKVKFDSVFAISDMFAMAVIRALDMHGIKVPDDVAVVGYDDITLAGYYVPPITSVHQDREIGGKLLAEKILRIVDGFEEESVVLETQLVPRQSSLGYQPK